MIVRRLVMAVSMMRLSAAQQGVYYTLLASGRSLSTAGIAELTAYAEPTIKRVVQELRAKGMVRRFSRDETGNRVEWSADRSYQSWTWPDTLLRTACMLRGRRLSDEPRTTWSPEAGEAARRLRTISGSSATMDPTTPTWQHWCGTFDRLLDQALHPVVLRDLLDWFEAEAEAHHLVQGEDPPTLFVEHLPDLLLAWRADYERRRRTYL